MWLAQQVAVPHPADLRANRSGEYTTSTSTGTWQTRSRSRSRAGRTRLAPDWPSSQNIHCSGTSRPACSACARSAAVWDPIVSCSFCRADETRAQIAALLIGTAHFLTGPHAAGRSFGDKDAVGRRQFRGLQAVEDELGVDHPFGHRRGWSLWARARNSSNACATTADSVRPDAAACPRIRAATGTGSLTVNTAAGAGTSTWPERPARATYRCACRGEQSNRSASSRTASAAGTPADTRSAAALTRSANSAPPARARPAEPPPPRMSLTYYATCHRLPVTRRGRSALR